MCDTSRTLETIDSTASSKSLYTEKACSTDKIPYSHFSNSQKIVIVIIVSFTSILGPLSSDIFLPNIQEVGNELNATVSEMTWTMTGYIVSLGVFPLMWCNIADHIGRRYTYILSLPLFIAGSVGCACSHSLPALVISRIIQASGSSPGLSVGAGSMSDIYPREHRSRALSVNYIGSILGPAMGPIIGGYIGEAAGWRWVFWFLTILGGILLIANILFLPETHRRLVLEKHQIQNVSIPPKPTFKENNPIHDSMYLKYPVIAIAVFYSSMVFGSYFSNITALPLSLQNDYGLSKGGTGLGYLPIGVGCIVGSLLGGRIADYSLKYYKSRTLEMSDQSIESPNISSTDVSTNIPIPPEARLCFVWIGDVLMLGAIITSGWLMEKNAPLAAVLTTEFFIGFGNAYLTQFLFGYLIDVLPRIAARIMGIQNCLRMCWAGILTQIFPMMLDKIGRGWSHTLVFFLLFVGALLIEVVYRKGIYLRSRFGPSIDN